jgi:GTP-binding protein HflX
MEKAILIGIQLPKTRKAVLENSLSELSRLAETAGARPVEKIIQKREAPDPAYLIGRGKAEELREIVRESGICSLIFDDDLKPGQQKNLEELIEAKIIDRTRLILDIFAQRAHSREGILQVERAQLAYYLPRLTKKGTTLDNQVGGIGTRGPGERKLEVDQRRIRDRVALLDREIEQIREHRSLLRQKRTESGQPIIAIVGYTNAGKSTLLNTLSHNADVYADDKLFATLDPTTRQVRLPGGRIALFTDTVGFIEKLPHSLIAAFRATLEEITRANCLLHLVDISHPACSEQVKTVLHVLKELNAEHIPVLTVYNKADLLPEAKRRKLEREHCFLLSAKTGQGMNELLARIADIVTPRLAPHRISIPYGDSDKLARVFDWAVVRKQTYDEKGVTLYFESTPGHWQKIRALLKRKRPLSSTKI